MSALTLTSESFLDRVAKDRSWRLLSAAVAGGAGVAGALLRRRYLRWGATQAERRSALPGDELLPAAHLVATRAISISAAPATVWPWLAQLGQGRGGFYSYDFLENLVGCDMHSADRVHPEWQQVMVGDEVRLAPQLPLAVAAAAEQSASLVLRGGVPMGSAAPPYDFTWTFVVRRGPDGTSRLVVRERYLYTRRWAGLIVQPVELVSCLMTVRMLRGIKKRAEHALPRPVIHAQRHTSRPQPGSYADVDLRADAVTGSVPTVR